jgi:hypothetical protein
MKAKWSKLSKPDKIINALIIVLSVAVIALAALQLLGIWKNSINVYEPLVGVVLLLQAKLFWKKNRKIAVIQLCASGFVFICAFVILVLPLLQ